MTWLLTARGYELIAVDGSEDMLAAATAKTGPGIPPVFLHQSMPQLDLYGTVDAAICCLDSLNYLTNPRDVQRTFERLHLFIAPGGTLIFDVNTPRSSSVSTGRSTSTRRRTPTASGARSSAAGYAATMSTSLTCGRTARGSAGSSITASAATPPRS